MSFGGWVGSLPLAVRRYRNELPDRGATEVEAGLVIGGVPTRWRWQRLRALGVGHALCLLAEAPPDSWMSDSLGLLWLPVPDMYAPTIDQLRAASEFIDEARAVRSGVMIYCGSGIGRAPATYLAWRVARSRESIASALVKLQRARPCVALTESQVAMLVRWEQLCCNRA